MNKYTTFSIFNLALFVLTGWAFAQTGEKSAPLPTYRIPLPESTFLGDWVFKMEVGPVKPEPFQISLLSYSPRGTLVQQQDFGPFSSTSAFTWEGNKAKQARIQSLVLISDVPLTGVMWMWNDNLGIINGVAIDEYAASSVVLPHIPTNYFAWRSNFAVMGSGQDGTSGDLIFSFYDNQGANSGDMILGGLAENQHVTGSPYHDIAIGVLGENTAANWGTVRSSQPGFELSGYETFLKVVEPLQSCAIEIGAEPASIGFVGFSKYQGWDFSEWFTFTNPNDEIVNLNLQLTYKAAPVLEESGGLGPGEDTPAEPLVLSLEETLQLNPFERKALRMGIDFLTQLVEVDGEPLMLTYSATALPEPPSEISVEAEEFPLPIHAVHFQSNIEGTALGAHGFTSELGRYATAWFNLSQDFESLIEVFNPSLEKAGVKVTFSDAAGNVVHLIEFSEIPANGALQLQSRTLREQILAENEGLSPSAVLRIDVSLQNGSGIYAKTTAIRETEFGRDLAIVDPKLRRDTEPPPEFLTAPH